MIRLMAAKNTVIKLDQFHEIYISLDFDFFLPR